MASNKLDRRVFLGWQRPILVSAIDWIVERWSRGDQLDLGGCTIVFPARRAGRRFAELLTAAAQRDGMSLTLPKITTVGGLPERLYRPSLPVASPLEQTLAWCRVLQDAEPARLSALIANAPSANSLGAWLELAGAIRRLHEELSSEGLRFTDVANHFVDVPAEASRWSLLSGLATEYLDALGRAGRADPFAERLLAIAENGCRCDGEVVLIGAVDLNTSLRQMIGQVITHVSTLVGAPAEHAGLFDEHGCVIAAKWIHRSLDITDADLVPASDWEDQSIAAAELVSTWSESLNPGRVTIGITDEAMIAPVAEQLISMDFVSHAELGEPLVRSAPGRLVSLVIDYVSSRSFAALAALVRHADMSALLQERLADHPNWMVALDRLRSEHFPLSTVDPLPEAALDRDEVGELIECVDAVVEPLAHSPLPLRQWCEALLGTLHAVYQGRTDSLPESWRQRCAMALDRTTEVIEHLANISAELEVTLPIGTVSEMIMAQLAESRLHLTASADAIALVGWLDLALDDGEAMCVVGLNEPFVPESVVADPFLPGSLRHQLGIGDNDQRYARDAYALTVIRHSRRLVKFIVGRTSVDGSPTPPSRLLAACTPNQAAVRTRMLLEPLPQRAASFVATPHCGEVTRLPVPCAVSTEPPTSLSVTAFGDYLRCPYRFYLRHMAKTRPLEDQGREMAANQFGNLVHDALELFGTVGPKHSTDPEQVESFLLDAAATLARKRFGEHPSAPIRLQINSAIERLRTVAARQVDRTREGWLLQYAEKAVEVRDNALLVVDGAAMHLKGRIDRVDWHQDSDTYAVLDYKTHREHPRKKHIDGDGKWKDLQLPLYRYMLRAIGVDAEPEYVQLGYFNIGEKANDIGVNIARFTSEEFKSADEQARQIVREIRLGHFDPNPEAATAYDDYAIICQTGVLGRLSQQDDDAFEAIEAVET